MYVDITWQCELVFCNVHSHVKECRADILNICCNYCPRVSALYYNQTQQVVCITSHLYLTICGLYSVHTCYIWYIFQIPIQGCCLQFLCFHSAIHLFACGCHCHYKLLCYCEWSDNCPFNSSFLPYLSNDFFLRDMALFVFCFVLRFSTSHIYWCALFLPPSL